MLLAAKYYTIEPVQMGVISSPKMDFFIVLKWDFSTLKFLKQVVLSLRHECLFLARVPYFL